MKETTRRVLSCVLAFTLLVTCTIAGIVLPASAATVGPNLLPADVSTFDETDTSQYVLFAEVMKDSTAGIVDDPADASNKCLKLQANTSYILLNFSGITGFQTGVRYRWSFDYKHIGSSAIDMNLTGASAVTGYMQRGDTPLTGDVSDTKIRLRYKEPGGTSWVTTCPEWTRVIIEFVPSDNFSVIISGVAAGAYIDNVQFSTVVPDDIKVGENVFNEDVSKFDADSSAYGDTFLSSLFGAGQVVADPADSGNKCLKLPTNANGRTSFDFNKYPSYQAGVRYRLSFDYKTSYTPTGAPNDFQVGNVIASERAWYIDGVLSSEKDARFRYKNDANGDGVMDTSGNWLHAKFGDGNWHKMTLEFVGDPSKALPTVSIKGDATGAYIDNVEFTQVSATSVKLNATELILGEGTTFQLSVSAGAPTFSYLPDAVWQSSDTSVATVDENGLVTVVGNAGEQVTITATSGSLAPVSCKITVAQLATSFTFADDVIKLAPPVTNGNNTWNVYCTPATVGSPAGSYVTGLEWSSSDPTVATVDAITGQVTALKEGTTTITAVMAGTQVTDTVTVTVCTDGERITGGTFDNDDWKTGGYWTDGITNSGIISVMVDSADVTNKVLAVPNASGTLNHLMVNAEKSYKLTFKAKGDGTASQKVYWQTPDGWDVEKGKREFNVADTWQEYSFTFNVPATDFNPDSLLTLGNGTTGVVYVDDVSMVELPDATALKFSVDTMKMPLELLSTVKLTTTPAEAGVGTRTWTSNDESIVQVDQLGRIKAKAYGTATVTLTTSKGLTDSVVVTVAPDGNVIADGDFEQKASHWSCSSSVAIKDGIGKDGTVGVEMDTIRGENGSQSRASLGLQYMLPVIPGQQYEISYDYKMYEGQSINIQFGTSWTVTGTKDDNGVWKKASKVITVPANFVDNFGWSFAVGCTNGGVEGTPHLVIDNLCVKLYDSGVDATSVQLDYTSMSVLPGNTKTLTLVATPSDGNVNLATWTSSDENVATVDYGVVTGVGKGTAIITATTPDGLSASCTVTVGGGDTLVFNSTFDKENDTSWTISGNASIVEGVGVAGSSVAAVKGDGKFTQTVTGLKPSTTYRLFMRYMAADTRTELAYKLGNDTVSLVDTPSVTVYPGWANVSWIDMRFRRGSDGIPAYVAEFTTPDTITEDDEFTLEIGTRNNTGYMIYVDNVFIAEKAPAIDFVVESLVWFGGDRDLADQVLPGTELEFIVTVSNEGQDPVPAGSTFMVDICMDGTVIQQIPYTFTEELATGGTAIIASEQPWAAVKGNHMMSAKVNSTLSILEADDSNNGDLEFNLYVADELLTPPEIAQMAGFNELIFNDEFDGDYTIDKNGTGAIGYKWYVTRPYGSTNVTPEEYSVENGILTLKGKGKGTHLLETKDVKTGLGFDWKFGYMEVRMRIPDPDAKQTGATGGQQAIWSMPIGKIQNKNSEWVEMDWLEFWGVPTGSSDGNYTVTIWHESIAPDATFTYYNRSTRCFGLGDGEWHTLGWLWQRNMIIHFYDGVEVKRQVYSDTEEATPPVVVEVGMLEGFDGTGAYSPLNYEEQVLIIGGSESTVMELDYVRIWQGADGGTYNEPAPGTVSDNNIQGGMIDISAEDFAYNYTTDLYGDLIVGITEENYQFVLDGEHVWEQLSEERRAEINEYLAANGQPSYEELLAAAKAFYAELVGGSNSGSDEGDAELEDSPDTGERFPALPVALGVTVVLSTAALWFTRKRKNAQ